MLGTNDYLSPSEETILAYIAIFRNGNSCAKYLEAIRWAQRIVRKPCLWNTDSVLQCLRGLKKVTKSNGSSQAFAYADWELQLRLVECAKSEGEFAQALAYVLAG